MFIKFAFYSFSREFQGNFIDKFSINNVRNRKTKPSTIVKQAKVITSSTIIHKLSKIFLLSTFVEFFLSKFSIRKFILGTFIKYAYHHDNIVVLIFRQICQKDDEIKDFPVEGDEIKIGQFKCNL